MSTPNVVASLLSIPSMGAPTAPLPTNPEPWESWGIASRWDPHRGWHHPTDEAP